MQKIRAKFQLGECVVVGRLGLCYIRSVKISATGDVWYETEKTPPRSDGISKLVEFHEDDAELHDTSIQERVNSKPHLHCDLCGSWLSLDKKGELYATNKTED